jgi:hypothetical protein
MSRIVASRRERPLTLATIRDISRRLATRDARLRFPAPPLVSVRFANGGVGAAPPTPPPTPLLADMRAGRRAISAQDVPPQFGGCVVAALFAPRPGRWIRGRFERQGLRARVGREVETEEEARPPGPRDRPLVRTP